MFLHGRLINVADSDSFYHIRHAWLYRTAGIFDSSFPWTQYSVVSKYAADIWYGFHVGIVPFTAFNDLANGIKWGALAVTIIASTLFFLALLKLKVRWPILWLGIFLFASADLLYRLAMLRPHPLSLGLSMILFAYLAAKETTRSRMVIFAIAAGLSWIHLSLSWIALLIVAVIATVEFIQKQEVSGRKYLAVIIGLIVGWILRPNPVGAARLAYIQVVKLLFEKQNNLPLRFGRELKPFVWENFVDQLIPITIIVLIAAAFIGWFYWRKTWTASDADTKGPIISAAALAGVFFLLTFGVARRSNEIFIGFAVIFVALVLTYLIKNTAKYDWPHYLAATLAIIAVIYMPFKTIYRFDTYLAGTFEPDRFRTVSEWLKQNSQPEEIVFNIHWDRFAQLFYWNQHNYFINGMDPIFEYAYDPALYWKTHFLAIDAGTAYTCGKIKCTAEEVEPTPQVLKNDFGASYILVEKHRSPKVFEYLNTSPDFKKSFEDHDDALFKIL